MIHTTSAERGVRNAVITVFGVIGLPLLLWALADLFIQRSSKYPISSTYIALGGGLLFTVLALRLWMTRNASQPGEHDIEFQGSLIGVILKSKVRYLNVSDVLRMIGVSDKAEKEGILKEMRRNKECTQTSAGLFASTKIMRPMLEAKSIQGNRRAAQLLRKIN